MTKGDVQIVLAAISKYNIENFIGERLQYFICKVPLSDIPKLLDNKKSIWKYRPDTDVHYL